MAGEQIWVPGPVEIHVGTGSAGALEFLGYSEQGVRPRLMPAFDPVYADVSGTRVPYDVAFMGEEAMVAVNLQIYKEDVYEKIARRVRTLASGRGTAPAGSVGTLMRLEGQTFRLLLYPAYITKTAFSGMPAYNFAAAYLAGPDDLPMAVRYKTAGLAFHCLPSWSSVGGYTLYDHSTTGRSAP